VKAPTGASRALSTPAPTANSVVAKSERNVSDCHSRGCPQAQARDVYRTELSKLGFTFDDFDQKSITARTARTRWP
jgi:hypothetical protein